jgi:hypothetical protein
LALQYTLTRGGYKTVQRFTGLADDRAGLREALRQDFGVDPSANGATDRVKAASVIAAWESAKEFRSKEVQLRARRRLSRFPRRQLLKSTSR